MDIFKFKYRDFSIVILIGLLLTLLSNYLLYIAAGLITICAFLSLNKKYLPGIIAVILLSVTSTINAELRNLAYVLCYGIFFILYVDKYKFSLAILKELPGPIKILACLLLFSLTASTIFSKSFLIGGGEILRMFLFLLVIFLYYIFVEDLKDVRIMINALIVTSLIMSASIIISFLRSDVALYILETKMVVKEGGYLGNVAGTGGTLAITIPLTLYMLSNTKTTIKWFYYIALFFEFFALFLTNSRGAIIGALVAVCVYFAIIKGRQFLKILGGIITSMLLVFFYFPSALNNFDLYFRTSRILENTRYFLWDIAFTIIKTNPIFGVGPGMFKYYMYKYLPVMLGTWDERQIGWVNDAAGTGHAHNFYLYRASETGLVGLLISLCFPILFFIIAKRVLRKYNKCYKIYTFSAVSISILTGMLYRAFVESTGIITNGWITRDLGLWVIFVLISAIYYKKFKVDENTNIS